MNCEKENYYETLQRKIMIPYIKEVKNHCEACTYKDNIFVEAE